MDPLSNIVEATTGQSIGSSSASAPSILQQDEFLTIMIAELTNQDPLEPMDNQQFLGQLVQMQTLQATTQLSEGIESLLLGQQISSAGALIGQHVVGEDANGGRFEGVVDRVVISNQKVSLGIGDLLAPINSVQELLGVDAAE